MTRIFTGTVAALALSTLSVQAVEVQEVISPGGINAWLAEDHTIPLMALEIIFVGGSSTDPEDKLGSAYLMTGLLDEGAGQMDAAAFQKRQQELAAAFAFRTHTESTSVSVRFLTEFRDESVSLLKTALEQPRFDLDRVEFVRAQVLSILADHARDQGKIANRTVDRLTYGDHPFARPVEGTLETAAAITVEDLEESRRRVFDRSGVIVGAAGDITAAELGDLLDNLLGGLPSDGIELPEKPEFLLQGGVDIVDFPSPQSLVLFLHEGLLRDDPDFLAAYVINEALGSRTHFSRLRLEVRENLGLTYSIGTYLGSHSNSGFIAGDFSTSNEFVAEAIDAVKQQWANLAAEGMTVEELERVKLHLTGAYPLRFDGNERIARILAAMQFDNIPASYIENRNAMINAFTVDDIKRVAERLLKPDKLHFVVVGQPESLQP